MIIGTPGAIYVYHGSLIARSVALVAAVACCLFARRTTRASGEAVTAHPVRVDVTAAMALAPRVAISGIAFTSACLIPHEDDSILVRSSSRRKSLSSVRSNLGAPLVARLSLFAAPAFSVEPERVAVAVLGVRSIPAYVCVVGFTLSITSFEL